MINEQTKLLIASLSMAYVRALTSVLIRDYDYSEAEAEQIVTKVTKEMRANNEQ